MPRPCLAMMAVIAPNTANGAKPLITYDVIFNTICATASSAFTTGWATSPNAAAATPKNRENTTICSISFLAMASITLAGKT